MSTDNNVFEAWSGTGSGWKGTKGEKMGNISNTDNNNNNKKRHLTLRYTHLHKKATI